MNPIEKTKGPCIILAGAGTGKTHTLVQKISHLLDTKAYNREDLVCLTFSNEATESLKRKLINKIKDDFPIIKTFHSFCFDIIKENNKEKTPQILLPDEAKIMLHKNLRVLPRFCHLYIKEIGMAKDLGIKLINFEELIKKDIASSDEINKTLTKYKLALHTAYLKKERPSEDLKQNISELEKRIDRVKFIKIWKAYEKIKERLNLYDYSDLIIESLKILKEKPKISQKHKYIIVDEFQDTNKLQCDFLYEIAKHKNITVVGDLNQSIYQFRGAYSENLNYFKKLLDIKEEDIFTLAKSYRSTNKILKVANKAIQKNHPLKKQFEIRNAFNTEGEKLEVYRLLNNKEEVRKITEIIKLESDNTKPENICVIFRTHQQANLLKRYLEKEKISFTSISKRSILKIRSIKLIKSYLEVLEKITNKKEGGAESWWEIIHSESFENSEKIKIGEFIKKNKNKNLTEKIIHEEINLEEKSKKILDLIIKRIKRLIPHIKDNVSELIKKIYEEIFNLNESSTEEIMILEKFYSLAKEHEEKDKTDIKDFLDYLGIINLLGIEIEAPSANNKGVRIMTAHATKGLEYKKVIISNCVNGKFPIIRKNESLIPSELLTNNEEEKRMAEERRLFYVSLTRAKSKVYITYAEKYSNKKTMQSCFLEEIDYKNNKDITFTEDNEEKYQNEGINQPISIKNNKELIFSPSSLRIFDECQKKYEYKYIYNMPEPSIDSWDAIKLGSFVHKVLEEGVRNKLKSEEDFINLVKISQIKEEWKSINLEEAIPLIKVFYERNKTKLNSKSLVEKRLSCNIENLQFIGIADRIDFTEKGLEIIDYKTGLGLLPAKYRNWQLGFYAIASQSLGKPHRLTLEMLQKEKPIEFELDSYGNAKEIHSKQTSFNLNEVKNEIIKTAKEIKEAQKTGFKPCNVEKNCQFCEEFVYNN